MRNRTLLMAASLTIALTTRCVTSPSPSGDPAPQPAAQPSPEPPGPHGITALEEAGILRMEDRRHFDKEAATTWLNHPNSLHRARMALALGRIGTASFDDENENGERDNGETMAGVRLLLATASDPDANVRRNIAFALGEIGDPAAVEGLFAMSADRQHADVASEAVEALSKIASATRIRATVPTAATTAPIAAIASSVPLARYAAIIRSESREGVRARAIRYAFRFDEDEASAIAAEALGDPSPKIRTEAAYALSRRAFAPGREKLELLLSDSETLTRAYAARALGAIADKTSIGPLIESLGDPHPWVRTNAARSIGLLAKKDPGVTQRPEGAADVLRLVTTTDDADPGTRATAIETLGFYGRYDLARKRLTALLADGSKSQRELAAASIARSFDDAASLLKAPLADPANIGMRRLVLDATAETKLGSSLRKELMRDEDGTVRASVIGSIPDAAVDAEIAMIRTALTDRDEVVRANAVDRFAMQKKGDAAAILETLLEAEKKAANDAMNDARMGAIRAVGAMEWPGREAFLRERVGDKDPMVRRLAADLTVEKLKKTRPQYTPIPLDGTIDLYDRVVEWARKPHTATIHLSRGNIQLMLLPQEAPMTAWNFAQLAGKGYFNGTSFMRVVPNFVIQGGDPRNDMNGGPGYSIRDEINLQRYTRGAVGMALSGPDTGGSQFFITHSPQPHLDGGYTIFARVVGGMGGVADQVERGDKVEKITIDEEDPTKKVDLYGAEGTPLPTEVGPTSAERLLKVIPEYASRMKDYKPDPGVIEFLATSLQPADKVEIYLGTWCPDSQREVPNFLKIVEMIRSSYGRDLPLQFVGVDRSKKNPVSLLAGKSIEKVATFIVYRGGEEIGRIVETPTGLLEDHLLQIVAAKK